MKSKILHIRCYKPLGLGTSFLPDVNYFLFVDSDQEAAKKELQRLVDSIVDLWLQPEINQLVPKE